MSAQNSLNALVGTVIGGAAMAAKGIKENKNSIKANGTDAKMATKARQTAQQKIDTILENREISKQARIRRMEKITDENQGGGR